MLSLKPVGYLIIKYMPVNPFFSSIKASEFLLIYSYAKDYIHT